MKRRILNFQGEKLYFYVTALFVGTSIRSSSAAAFHLVSSLSGLLEDNDHVFQVDLTYCFECAMRATDIHLVHEIIVEDYQRGASSMSGHR